MSPSTNIRLLLYCRSRVLEPPLSPPNLRCHYARKECYRQNHRLTAEAHARASSRNPLKLEVDDAEATSCPTKYQPVPPLTKSFSSQLTATCSQ
jgi:hypothetical protein